MRSLRGNPWAILLTLSLGFFMTLLDLTIVNIAVPSMLDSLGASLDEVLWVINSYVLVLAVLLITAGRLGDLRGQRNMFALGVVIFTVASLACGLAPNAALLIAFRAVQGLGAAFLMPQTMAIIVAVFPPQNRGAALGVWGAVAGLATVAGPTLGGLLVTVADWRWIFFVNVPIGVVVLVMTYLFVPDTRFERRHRLDLVGVALATVALFCLTFALTEGQRFDWNGWIWGLMVAFVVLLAVFLLHQRGRQDREPLVPFALFRDRNFTVLNLVAALVSVGIIGFFFPLTIYLQSVLGYSALKAGLVMAPMSLISMVLSPFAGRLTDRVGGKFVLMGGLTLFALGGLWLTLLADTATNWPTLQPAIAVMGVGFGFIFAPMATEALRGISPQMAGAAAGVNNTNRQLGSAIGSAAVGALLQHRLVATLADEAQQRSGALPADVRTGFVQGFRDAGRAGLEVGGGQAPVSAPDGVPAAVAREVARIGREVYTHGYVDAMHPAMVLPIAATGLAALACLLLQRRTAHHAPAGTAGRAQVPAEPVEQA
jgi:EmrB/QacA subfamily drug resistance transporter